MSKGRCWVCLRITPQETLKLAHRIWENPKVARKIGLEASKLIEECYQNKPTFFCGKPRMSVLSGLFYLLGFKNNVPKPMREISKAADVTSVTIKVSYRRWLKHFPEFFPEFDFGEITLSDGSSGIYPKFKGKRVDAYH